MAAGLLVAFALVGDDLLRIIGVSLPGVRVGGGILQMLVSIDIVFGHPIGPGHPAGPRGDDDGDISVFPLAMPIIAFTGGVMATGLLRAVIATVMLITLGGLVAAGSVQRWVGHTATSVAVRILDILLAAVSAEMILAGLRESGIFSRGR